jgi:hypothetical protein
MTATGRIILVSARERIPEGRLSHKSAGSGGLALIQLQ